ncbi:MAG: hypothetical protein INH40_10590 [Acidobacteriaceae bacterium]|jgi:hypothetical protein|nr:hypothetical protein [Acidobacteriaceae bacterium]
MALFYNHGVGLASWIKGLFAFAPGDPLVSVVFLLQDHRELPQNTATLAATRAWGEGAFTVQWPRLTLGPRTFVMQSVRGMFVEDLAAKVTSAETGAAVRRHRGWWSIDLQSGPADDEAYLLMGKLMAVLLNANCLAVYYPQSGTLELVDQHTGSRLVAGD